MSSRKAVEVVVLPVFRRRWLWIARPGAEASATSGPMAPASSSSSASPSSSPTLSQKLRLARKSAGSWASSKLHDQWNSIARAPPNSFKGVMHRLARAVLDREDPDAAFLRSLPVVDEDGRDRNSLDSPLRFSLLHPPSEPQRLVRRRTRLLVRRGRAEAKRRLWGWGALTVPLLPVLLTPLPALPLYYCIWKAWTARAALKGSKGLAEALDAVAEEQAREAAGAVVDAARATASSGGVSNLPPRGSWADAALALGGVASGPGDPGGRYLDIFDEGRREGRERERAEGEGSASGDGGKGGERPRRRHLSPRPRIELVPSPEIDPGSSPSSSSPSPSSPSAAGGEPPPPRSRRLVPLSLEEAGELEERLSLPGLKEGVQRVLRSARKEIEAASGAEARAGQEKRNEL